MRIGLIGVALSTLGLVAAPCAQADQVYLNSLAVGVGGVNFGVKVQSFQSRKFITTIKQEYDFSCGSAALATLLTFSYGRPTTESEVFSSMYLNGNRSEIQQFGFSLLDIKDYLARIGMPSGGFKAPLSKLAEARIPAIVLINEHGFKHFVVIRGIEDDRVLLADPALGLRSESLHVFQKQWSGIFFLIETNIQTAQANFNGVDDWSKSPGAPLDLSRFSVNLSTLQQVNVPVSSSF
ncbi:MAG: peptidase C39 [Acidocella sp. 20-61-6]|nr:MAG: peptidase C39 [Acidocella sp. 20-61-6]